MHHDDLKMQLQFYLRQFIRNTKLKDAVYDPEILKKIAENIIHLKECSHRLQQDRETTDELKMNAQIIENMMMQDLEAEGVECCYFDAAKHLVDGDDPKEMRALVKELVSFSSKEERSSLIDHFAHIADNPESTLD
jgi:hypothetical protein